MAERLLYVIETRGRFKIGQTRDLSKRLASLQTANPDILTVYYQLATPYALDLEYHLKRHFAAKRLRGEWFALDADDLIELQRIAMGYLPPVRPRRPAAVRRPSPDGPSSTPAPRSGGLRGLLAEYGVISQVDLCRRTGLAKQYVWVLWHGRVNVSMAMASRLSDLFQIPLERFHRLPRRPSRTGRGRGRPPKSPRIPA